MTILTWRVKLPAMSAETNSNELLGQVIKDRRLAEKWTLEELANRARVSRSTAYRLETARGYAPTATRVARVLHALGLMVEDIDDVVPKDIRGKEIRAWLDSADKLDDVAQYIAANTPGKAMAEQPDLIAHHVDKQTVLAIEIRGSGVDEDLRRSELVASLKTIGYMVTSPV
jgi:transcriptional regulator with XRE-family HTH domain